MSTNRKAYLTCEFNDDNGVQCNVRHTTTGFKKKLNLCKKHYHKTVTPSTTPTVSLVSLNNALKNLLPQSFHRKIDQCCHQTKDYSLLSLRVKQQKAKLLGGILEHIAGEMCSDEIDADLLLQSLIHFCPRLSPAIVESELDRKK